MVRWAGHAERVGEMGKGRDQLEDTGVDGKILK
jgi:hypothetical protein